MLLAASGQAGDGTFQAMFDALNGESLNVIGPADPRLLVIPILDAARRAIGGLSSFSLFRWLQVRMVFVPRCVAKASVPA